jgi:hypothetical protein
MKRTGLRSLIGQVVKLRPAVRRVDFDGTLLPSIDDDWRVHATSQPNAVVELHNLATGHFLPLGPDNVFEFRSPKTLVLKEQLTLFGRDIIRDPLPDPRARYSPPGVRSR